MCLWRPYANTPDPGLASWPEMLAGRGLDSGLPGNIRIS